MKGCWFLCLMTSGDDDEDDDDDDNDHNDTPDDYGNECATFPCRCCCFK